MGIFVRMLVLQAVLAILVSLVSVSFYYFERNKTVAKILAGQWEKGLSHAISNPHEDQYPGIHAVRQDKPPTAMLASAVWPQVSALKHALADQNIHVQGLAFEEQGGVPIVWLEVPNPGHQEPRWLAVQGPLFEPGNIYFIAITLCVSSVLVLAFSWTTSRQLARPLERLRHRIQQGRPETAEERHASRAPEVADIAQAYDALLVEVTQQAKDRSLMLVGISHDLRTPLSRIRLAAELLPEGSDPTSLRQSIIRNTQVADALIESFMDVVRAGDWPVDETVDVAEQARLVTTDFAHDGHAVLLTTSAPALQWSSNHYLIRRMLHNLVENAVKHGRPPVEVTVLDQGDQGVWVEVVDAGKGIANDQQQAVLRAFARGDGSRSTPGSGLGLTVVQQVLARVGGTLSFAGGPGRWAVRIQLSGNRARSG